MSENETTFDWTNLPADLVRAFARELVGGRPDTEASIDVLREHAPVPGTDFFRHYGVRWVAANVWLRDDEAALDHVHAALVGGPISAPPRRRVPGRRAKLAAVKRVVDPPDGARQTEAVRQAVRDALLLAGGGVRAAGESATLRPFNVIPTHAAETLPPHPHQEFVIDALRSNYDAEGDRMVGVVVMPTGAGKTVTAVQWLLRHPVRDGVKVLWVTHRRELLEQTATTFVRCAATLADQRDRLTMRLIGGGYGNAGTIVDGGHDVVVASIGSLARNMGATRAFLAKNRCVVVFDEAHHAVAPTWRDLLEAAREVTDDAVVGLTATPTRMAGDERRVLGRLFEKVIAEVSIAELVGKKYLAEARTRSVETGVSPEAVADDADFQHLERYGELSPSLARALADNVPRNRLIVDEYRKGPADADDDSYGQTIVFAVNVDHAHVLARDFALAGYPAGALTASISTLYRPTEGGVQERSTDRTELLDAFRAGDIPVLVNVQVLTEGVDVPAAKTAFLARPTGSQVLMSQMVGRALRGEAVGGTSHAYLVSFRDHWELFPDWADPIRLLPPSDVEVEPRASGERGPTGFISEAEWRRLLQAAADEVKERIPASLGRQWAQVPVGLYAFETELPIDDEWAGDDEIEARHVDLYVHHHERVGFERLHAAVTAGETTADPAQWLRDFFAEIPDPLPPASRLELLARYVGEEGRMPPFIPLEGRDDIDPHRLARTLYEADARREERGLAIADAHARNPVLVDVFYGGRDGFRRAVLEELYRREAGLPRSFDELRLPYVRAPDRVDHTFGEGAHDLAAMRDAVLADRALFPTPLGPPVGIRWTTRPFGSIWARYIPADDTREVARIEVNTLLDAKSVDADVVEFLIYHELLHHQDLVTGKTHPVTGAVHSPHDPDFREREARHHAILRANAWLDTFHDRLLAVDETGRAVP